MGKWCLHASSFIFDQIVIKVAGNQDRHKSLDEFDFGPLVSMAHLYVFEMRFDLGTLDSGEWSLPFGLLVFILADLFYSSGRRVRCVSNNTKYIFQFVYFTAHAQIICIVIRNWSVNCIRIFCDFLAPKRYLFQSLFNTHWQYRKNAKNLDTPKTWYSHPKLRTVSFYNRVMGPKDVEGMANSVSLVMRKPFFRFCDQ